MNITLNTDVIIHALDKMSLRLKRRKGGESRMYPTSTLKRWVAFDASQGSKELHDKTAERFSLPPLSEALFREEMASALERYKPAVPLSGLSQFYGIYVADIWVRTAREIYNNVLEHGRTNEIDLSEQHYDAVYAQYLSKFLMLMFQSYMSVALATDSVTLSPGLYGTEVITK